MDTPWRGINKLLLSTMINYLNKKLSFLRASPLPGLLEILYEEVLALSLNEEEFTMEDKKKSGDG